MAQRFVALALVSLFGVCSGIAGDAKAPPAAPAPADPSSKNSDPDDEKDGRGRGRRGGRGGGGGGGLDYERVREAFSQMTPEERERWIENFRRWQHMPAEQKKALSDRQEVFRRRMKEDVEKAITESGLQFTDEQRKQFTERYVQERRKIEEELRKQMDELRQPKLRELVAKLKSEFEAQTKQNAQTPITSPHAPAATPVSSKAP